LNINGIELICCLCFNTIFSYVLKEYQSMGEQSHGSVWADLNKFGTLKKNNQLFFKFNQFIFLNLLCLQIFSHLFFRVQLEQKSTNAVYVGLVGATQYTLDYLHQIGGDC